MKLGLDLSDVVAERESKTQFMPAGSYQAKVIDSEIKETKQKTGYVLYLYSQVIEGEHKGKVFCDNLNIKNSNVDAERIGLARLKKYVETFGISPKIDDSEVLHGKTFMATLVEDSFKTDKGDDIKSNKVKSVGGAGVVAQEIKKDEKPPVIKEEAPKKKAMPWEK